MGDLMITHGTVITLDANRRIIKEGVVVIEKDRILDIGESASLGKKYKAKKVIDAKNKVVMPGIVDCHVHNVQMLSRVSETILISSNGVSTGFIPTKN
jgi:cytosine/adenosine deaminase-related metal-dependent hydrolase